MSAERVPRTHPSQWAIIVEFLEQHTEMVTHKFLGINGKENFNKLWEELTTQLNSMGFGSKSCKKWQEVFGKWKSKIKIKAQEIRCGMKKTGGGGPLPQLTPIEERLMGIIGWKIVVGDENMEMGVENTFNAETKAAENTLGFIAPKIVQNPEPEAPVVLWEFPIPSKSSNRDDKNLRQNSAKLDIPPLIFNLKPSTSTTTMEPCMEPMTTKIIKPLIVKNNNLKKKEWKRKQPGSSTKQRNGSNLITMNKENVDELKNINLNLNRIAGNQEKQIEVFSAILDYLKSK